MNVSPYLIGILGLGLLTQGEYIFAGILLSWSALEVILPNLNATDTAGATFFRISLAAIAIILLIYRVVIR